MRFCAVPYHHRPQGTRGTKKSGSSLGPPWLLERGTAGEPLFMRMFPRFPEFPPQNAIRDGGDMSQADPTDPEPRQSDLWGRACSSCYWRRTPGLNRVGYCTGREDLPLAYGLLHYLPADLGENCGTYRPR